jgi:hypothetical protein
MSYFNLCPIGNWDNCGLRRRGRRESRRLRSRLATLGRFESTLSCLAGFDSSLIELAFTAVRGRRNINQ